MRKNLNQHKIDRFTLLLDRTISHHDVISQLPANCHYDLLLSQLASRINRITVYLIYLHNSGLSASPLSPVLEGGI